MSRQQWGHGYWKGVEDARNGTVREDPTMHSMSTPEVWLISASMTGNSCAVLESAVSRLHEKYNKGKLKHCVCEFEDAMLVREGGEIWTNWDSIKFNGHGAKYHLRSAMFNLSACPICGKILPAKTREHIRGDFKVY